MSAESNAIPPGELASELRLAALAFERDASRTSEVRSVLDRVEAATPAGAPLHSQLDNVRKWLEALEQPHEHARFGGSDHVRSYVSTQLRLAAGALEDYLRAYDPGTTQP